jgi:hypothetical protein
MSILEEKWTRKIRYNPETTYLVWSCRENGPNATNKNYDSLKPSLENLKRWNIYSNK